MSDRSVGTSSREREQALPLAWRPALGWIVDQLATGNYGLEAGFDGVDPLLQSDAARIQAYLSRYGATLMPLPEASWDSSICVNYGHHWDVLVDLWTREEGRSDLVLHAHVQSEGSDFRIRVHHVYVP